MAGACQTVGCRAPPAMPPVDRDDQQEPTGVLQYEQHKQLACCCDQLGVAAIGGEVAERIDNMESEYANQLIDHKLTSYVHSEHFQQCRGTLSVHCDGSISVGDCIRGPFRGR